MPTATLRQDRHDLTSADRAALHLIELTGELDKRTKQYRQAMDALALVNMIRRNDEEQETA